MYELMIPRAKNILGVMLKSTCVQYVHQQATVNFSNDTDIRSLMKIQKPASANVRKCLFECTVNLKYQSNIFIILNTIERLEIDHQGDKLNPIENKFICFF